MSEHAPKHETKDGGLKLPDLIAGDAHSADLLKNWIRSNVDTLKQNLGDKLGEFLNTHSGILKKASFTPADVEALNAFFAQKAEEVVDGAVDAAESAARTGLAAIAPDLSGIRPSPRGLARKAASTAATSGSSATGPEAAAATSTAPSSEATPAAEPKAPEAVAATSEKIEGVAKITAEKAAIMKVLAEKGYGKAGGKGIRLDALPNYSLYKSYTRALNVLRYRYKSNQPVLEKQQVLYDAKLQELTSYLNTLEVATKTSTKEAIVVPSIQEGDEASAAAFKTWLTAQMKTFTPEVQAKFDAELGKLELMKHSWYAQDEIDAVEAFFAQITKELGDPTKKGKGVKAEKVQAPVSIDDIKVAIADGKTKFFFTDSYGKRQLAVPYIVHPDANLVVFKWQEGEGKNKKEKSDTVELKVVRRVLEADEYQSADPKVHEKYDELRTKWKEAREDLHTKGNSYFSKENEEKQKAIAQELQDSSRKLGVPLLGLLFNRKRRKELKLEQAQNAQTYQEYVQAQQAYAQAFKDALNERKKYRVENTEGFDSYKAQLASRFFAKEGDPKYRYERSYLVSELEFNKAILPERKKSVLGNTLGIMGRLSYKERIAIGVVFAGAGAVSTGGLSLAGAAMLRYALGSTVGTLSSLYVNKKVLEIGEPGLRRQRALVLKTRNESIDMFDPSNFLISRELMQRTETKLQNKERNNKIAAAALGAGAAFIAGRAAAEGVTEFMASQAIPVAGVTPRVGAGVETVPQQAPAPVVGSETLQQGRVVTPLNRPQVGEVLQQNPRVVNADAVPKTPGAETPVPKFTEPNLPKPSAPDVLPVVPESIPSPYQGLNIPKPGQFETAFFDKWKAGGIKGLPGPDQMSSREFLARMRNAYGDLNGNKAVMDIARVPSNDINLVQPGEMNVQPFIDRMNGVSVREIEQGLQSDGTSPLAPDVSLRPQPRPTFTPEAQQPNGSIRPQPRPNITNPGGVSRNPFTPSPKPTAPQTPISPDINGNGKLA